VGGSATRIGDRVSVRIELIQARPERSLWSQRFDRSVVDLLGLQTELANSIAQEVGARLTPEERSRITTAPDIAPEAQDAYMRGRFALARPGLESYRTAIREFTRALQLDPSDARSWAGLADVYYYMSNVYLPPAQAMPLSRAAAEKALALDPNLAGAHAALAVVLCQYEWRWDDADREFRRALELSPNDASASLFYATSLAQVGRLEEAGPAFEAARALDPLSLYIASLWVQPDYLSGKYDRLLERLRALAETDSTFGPTLVLMGLCNIGKGRVVEAIPLLERGARASDNSYSKGILGYAYGRANRPADARRVLATLHDRAKQGHVSGYSFAIVHLGLGERDRAFEWLEAAFRRRDEDLIPISVDPLLAPLRGDPRYQSLLARMNLTGRRA
jgi:tetratricopeptide (TPR) repeat protein